MIDDSLKVALIVLIAFLAVVGFLVGFLRLKTQESNVCPSCISKNIDARKKKTICACCGKEYVDEEYY